MMTSSSSSSSLLLMYNAVVITAAGVVMVMVMVIHLVVVVVVVVRSTTTASSASVRVLPPAVVVVEPVPSSGLRASFCCVCLPRVLAVSFVSLPLLLFSAFSLPSTSFLFRSLVPAFPSLLLPLVPSSCVSSLCYCCC